MYYTILSEVFSIVFFVRSVHYWSFYNNTELHCMSLLPGEGEDEAGIWGT